MSNSFKKVEKIDPFNDVSLGEWAADKKHSNKDYMAFSRSAEINIPERYAQEWYDPVTFEKKLIWGRTVLTERKLISKQNSSESIQRFMEPALKGSNIKNIVPMN